MRYVYIIFYNDCDLLFGNARAAAAAAQHAKKKSYLRQSETATQKWQLFVAGN